MIKALLRVFLLAAVLAALPAWAGDTGRAPDPGPGAKVKVHFVVVSGSVEGGGDEAAALASLKERMVQLAGGFTELGATSGGSDSGGTEHREANYSFLVAAADDISADLQAAVKELFHHNAFILVWDAERK